ncbi:MAG: metallophosphoesterase [Opitutae bacterium]|nr:metallophosphoesterase [Opitutae bacterium]
MKRLNLLLIAMLVLAATSSGWAFDQVKFAVISDPHISLPQQKGVTDGFKMGLQTRTLTEATVAELNRIPDLQFVLVAGDLTQDAEPWNVDEVRRLLDQLNVPYFVTLGNHDLSRVPHEQKDQPVTLSKYTVAGAFLGRSGGMEPGMTYYAHEVAPGLVLVNLDSSRPQVYSPEAKLNDFGGAIDPAQLRWLEKTLRAHQGKTIMVMVHHSLVAWSPGEKTGHNHWNWFQLDNAREVQALLKKYGVKVVFNGHRHISTRAQIVDGIVNLIHPSLVTYPMRYTIYEMTPRELSYVVKDVPASPEIWEQAKKHFLATTWWRDADQPNTPEGNRRYLEFYESPSTLTARIALP